MRSTLGRRTMTMVLALGTVVGLTLALPRVAAGESEREAKWQFSFPVTFSSGTDYSSVSGSTVKIDDDLGWGIGFGYHVNRNFMVGVDFTWLSANYDAHIPIDSNPPDQIPDGSVDIGGTLDATNLQFVGQYNILKGRVTPFLRASLGWTWVDSNIPSGPTQGVCWWDPWWGYVCDAWQPTFQETSFAYGAAAGVRGELTEKFFVEGSYNVLWIDLKRAGTQSFDGVRLNVGWTF
jgi:opacity protein-like surface antigen